MSCLGILAEEEVPFAPPEDSHGISVDIKYFTHAYTTHNHKHMTFMPCT